jgi:hypothetical protein
MFSICVSKSCTHCFVSVSKAFENRFEIVYKPVLIMFLLPGLKAFFVQCFRPQHIVLIDVLCACTRTNGVQDVHIALDSIDSIRIVGINLLRKICLGCRKCSCVPGRKKYIKSKYKEVKQRRSEPQVMCNT